MFFIKARERGQRPFLFLSGSGFTRLRIYAAPFTDREKADAIVREIERENPHVESKVVVVSPRLEVPNA